MALLQLTKLRRSRVMRRLLRSRSVAIALVILLIVAVVAILAPWIMTHDPAAQDLFARFQGPSAEHWLGTDNFGRDQFSRLILATRISVFASVQAMVLALVLGIPTGLLAGQIGGIIDSLLSRLADALLALPPLILALAIIGILGRGLTNAMIAIGIILAPRFFRIARGEAQSISYEDYIEAARADGVPTWRLVGRHVLPNASSPLLIQTSFSFGLVIIAEAGLSFLGLGAQSPTPSWGTMIRAGFEVARTTAFPIFPPAALVVITIMALFLVGDGLRDALGRGEGAGH